MAEIKFIDLKCQKCGGELEAIGDNTYKCKNCLKAWTMQKLDSYKETYSALEEAIKLQKLEEVSNLKSLLWNETHKQFISNTEVSRLAKKILEVNPEDFYANFYLATCGSKDNLISFLNNYNFDLYLEDVQDVLDYLLPALVPQWSLAISNFIERAYKNHNLMELYNKYQTAFEKMAYKVDEGIYEPTLSRDVFVAYSSKDMQKVLELVAFLEEQGLNCFVASRNLRHGSGSVENYENAIKQALSNVGLVVFVSSTNSRNLTCDAYKEITYIKANLPNLKRIEYLVENYIGRPIEKQFKEFFKGKEYVTSKDDVFNRINELFAEDLEKKSQPPLLTK